MNNGNNKMSCAEFQSQLPELIGSAKDISKHPHIQECQLCRDFVDQLEAIADAARQLLPPVEPPDELWNKIESALKKD